MEIENTLEALLRARRALDNAIGAIGAKSSALRVEAYATEAHEATGKALKRLKQRIGNGPVHPGA